MRRMDSRSVLSLLAVTISVGCQPFHLGLSPPQTLSESDRAEAQIRCEKLDNHHTAELCVMTANRLSREGYTLKAVALYEKARYLDSQVDISHLLANNYAQLEMKEKAEEEYRKAIANTPDNANLLNDVGCFYLRSGRLNEANDALRKALAVDPDHQQAVMNLAECCVRNNKIQEGIDLYSTQVGRPAALSNTGILLASMGRNQEASDLLRQAIEADPNLPTAKAFLAKLDALATSLDVHKTRHLHR